MNKPSPALPDKIRDRSFKTVTAIVTAIKATGGYKYRQLFKLSDKELDDYLIACEQSLFKLAIEREVAVQMLTEYGHPSEFTERVVEALGKMRKNNP